MSFKQTVKKLQASLLNLRKHADRPWFLPLQALLAGADFFVSIIPTDSLLISCTLLRPQNWLKTAFWFAGGSTLGGYLLAVWLEHLGVDHLESWISGMSQSAMWGTIEAWVSQYGLWTVLGLSASPLVVSPAVVLCVIAGVSAAKIGWVLLLGRIVKYTALAAITKFAPRLLLRLPFLDK